MSKGKFAKRRGVATKTLVMALAIMLVVGCTIGGTLAWLTAESGQVTNTFTVGDINISIAETSGTSFKIVPGGTAAKDPAITVQAGSEKCYVYALVTNTVKLTDGTVVAVPQINSDWTAIGSNGDKTLYVYKEAVDASNATADVELTDVFSTVKYSDSITKDNIDTLNNTTIIVQGYAHQSENTTQDVANSAALKWAGITVSGS